MIDLLLKVEGSGNDFLLGLGAWAERLESSPRLVQRLCDRRRGVGADGALAVAPDGRDRVRLVHRNRDGRRTAFCGNGTRCAALVAARFLDRGDRLVVTTDWGDVAAEIAGSAVTLVLPAPDGTPKRVGIRLGGEDLDAWWLTVGVPHLVIPIAAVDSVDLASLAASVNYDPQFAELGTNVDVVDAAAAEPLPIRTWERGVDGETLSCGSGIVAAGLIVLADRGGRQLRLRAASGDELEVVAVGTPPCCPVRFTGPVRIVAEIRPAEDLLDGD